MRWNELDARLCERERRIANGENLPSITFRVVFKGSEPIEERTFESTSSNKMFIPGMGGYSCFAQCIGVKGWGGFMRIEGALHESNIEDCWEVEDEQV